MAKKISPHAAIKIKEDPYLLDDSHGSPRDWLGSNTLYRGRMVRRAGAGDPWQDAEYADSWTERRRRKLERLSLVVDVEVEEEPGEFAA